MRDTSIPTFSVDAESKISITIPVTEAYLTNQGYTYNQAGFGYNQAGWNYGGITDQSWDIVPTVLSMDFNTPHIDSFEDLYSTSIVPNTWHSVGPGWFLFITIP